GGAGAVVDQAGTATGGFERADPPLPLRALALRLRDRGGERGDLLIEILARPQAAIPRIGIDAEIADQQCRQQVKAEGSEEGTKAWTGNHAANMRRAH